MTATIRPLLARLAALVCVLALAACGGARPEPGPVKTVIVLSAIPDALQLRHRGPLRVTHQDVPIDTWDLTDLLVKQLAAILAQRYEVIPFDYERASLIEAARTPRLLGLAGRDSGLVARLREIAPQGTADSIVVALPTTGPQLYDDVNEHFIALGWRLVAYDGATFEPTATAMGVVKKPYRFVGEDICAIGLDVGWRGEAWEDVSSKTKATVREMVESLVRDSAPLTLDKLGMINVKR